MSAAKAKSKTTAAAATTTAKPAAEPAKAKSAKAPRANDTAARSAAATPGKPAPDKAVKEKPVKTTAPAKAAAKAGSTAQSAPRAAGRPTAKTAAQTATPKSAPAPSEAGSKKTARRKAAATTATAVKPARATRTKPQAGITSYLLGFPPYVPTKDEEYMNPRQKEHFRAILLAWKRELMEEVDRTKSHMQEEAANPPDPTDRATQEEEFSLELRARDRERKLLKKIEEALDRLDSNEFGYCEACGVEIGIKRLEARPTATLCIDCKTLDELKEKQLGL